MRLALLGYCAIVLLTSGCGGSRTSPAAFRMRADAICHELGLRSGTGVDTKAALDRRIRHAEAGIARLARLQPPSRDEHSYRDLIATLNRTTSLARTRFPALIENKSPSRQEVERLVRPLERDVRRATADARAVGLGTCARGISAGSTPSQPQQHGPTPQQVKSPAKRAFDRRMLAVHARYDNEMSKAGAPFMAAFHHGHRAVDKAMFTMLRQEARIYRDEASAVAQIKAPADARAEQRAIVRAYRIAAEQAGAASAVVRHPPSRVGKFVHYNWQGRLHAAVRRLEATGYALADLDSIGTLYLTTSNQP